MIFDHPECFNENSKFDSLNIFFTSKIFTFAARKKKKKAMYLSALSLPQNKCSEYFLDE